MTRDDVEDEIQTLRGMARGDARPQSVYLKATTIEGLRERAESFGVSMSVLVERAVARYLKDLARKE
jgi:hypothetical protein